MSTQSIDQVLGWPRLLKLSLAAKYAGMSEDTFSRICPVPPKDMGFRGLRWDRRKIDQWIDSLPDRDATVADVDASQSITPLSADERRRRSLERVKCPTP